MGAGSCGILLRVSRYLMNERSERVRDRLRHEKRKSISQSNHASFCLLYKHLASKRKPSLLAFQKENALRGNDTPISANEFSDTRNQSLVCFMPIHFDLILI